MSSYRINETIFAECLRKWQHYRGELSWPAYFLMHSFVQANQPDSQEKAEALGCELVIVDDRIEVSSTCNDAERFSVQSELDFWVRMQDCSDEEKQKLLELWQSQRIQELGEVIASRQGMARLADTSLEALTSLQGHGLSDDMAGALEHAKQELIAALESLAGVEQLKAELKRMEAMTPDKFIQHMIAERERILTEFAQKDANCKHMRQRIKEFMNELENIQPQLPEYPGDL